jgi:plastocyanin
LHGHRWVVPGPARSAAQPIPTASGDFVGGETSLPGEGVQNSAMTKGVSQFEDTKIFGPANSFSFTINEGSFMGPPLVGIGAVGEWHMHCHVLSHMSDGMMGSLLIIDDSEPEITNVPLQEANWDLVSGKVVSLPGDREMCSADVNASSSEPKTVVMDDDFYDPEELTIEAGSQVVWQNKGDDVHTATANDDSFNTKGVQIGQSSAPIAFNKVGEFRYECLVHGSSMSGKIKVIAATSKNAPAKVVMDDDFFDPEEVTIEVGSQVTWQNEGDVAHTATANNGSFDTEDVDAGDTSEPIQFDMAGEFRYECSIHGSTMSGKINVIRPSDSAKD